MMAQDGKRVLHCELAFNGGAVKLSDSFPDMDGHTAAPGAGPAPVTIHLNVNEPKHVDQSIQEAVKAGAIVILPAQDTFWGARYGRIRDPFGYIWALHAPLKKQDKDG